MTGRFISVGLRIGLAVACVFATGAALAPGGLPPDKTQRFAANGLRLDDPQLIAKLKALAVSRHAALYRAQSPLTIQAGGNKIASRGAIPLDNPPAATSTGGTDPTVQLLAVTASDPDSLVGVVGLNLFADGKPTVVPVVTSVSNCAAPGALPFLNLSSAGSSQVLYFQLPAVPGPESALLTMKQVSTGKAFMPPQNITIIPPRFDKTASDYVDYMSPYLAEPDALAQPASSFSTSGSHLSTDPADAPSSGTDVLGYGTNLENGWTAVATISNVHSYMDPPGSSGTNDPYRSATISQQPADGRLETRVAWSLQGGESISYTLTWTFSPGIPGSLGRIVSTMPKATQCTNEQ